MTIGSALQSLCESVRPLPVSKMFITLEPHGVSLSHFAYICMSTFPNHWHAKPLFG